MAAEKEEKKGKIGAMRERLLSWRRGKGVEKGGKKEEAGGNKWKASAAERAKGAGEKKAEKAAGSGTAGKKKDAAETARAGKGKGKAKTAGRGKMAGKKTADAKTAKEEEEAKKQIIKEMKERKASSAEQLKAYEAILYPLITEKAVNMIEAENKMVFIINRNACKADVRKAVETLYGVKVDSVNIMNDSKARKRALVKINKAFKAGDIATRLGVL